VAIASKSCEGFRAILIEREAEYQADIVRRMAHVYAPTRERRATIAKAKGKVEGAGPLFDENTPPANLGPNSLREIRSGRTIGPVGLKR
jgi:hypothetical protein